MTVTSKKCKHDNKLSTSNTNNCPKKLLASILQKQCCPPFEIQVIETCI